MPSPATIKDRFAAWHARHGDKLAAWHPAVAAEIRTTVFDRIRDGLSPGLTDAERRDCLMRVASRIRVHQGPAGDLRAIVETLGGKA